MAIVRELVTRLSFVFDRSNLDKFEKLLSGFKFRFTAISSALAYFGNKVLDKFNNIAKATLDTDELARSTKTATEDFIALQKAADQFRLSPENFNTAFKGLSDLLTEARFGGGKLFDIIQKSNRELNLAPFVQNHDVKGAFKQILEYVSTLKDVEFQLRALTDIFGEGAANGLLNIVNAGTEAFYRGAEANREYARSVVQNKDSLSKYEKDLKTFYTEVETLTQNLVKAVLPLLTPLVKGLSGILSGESFTDKGQAALHEKDKERFSQINSRTNRARAEFGLPEGGLPAAIRKWLGFNNQEHSIFDSSQSGYSKFLRDYEAKNSTVNTASNVITNNFEIAVPVGSPDGEANRIAELIKLSIENTFIEKSREIISNNPAVE